MPTRAGPVFRNLILALALGFIALLAVVLAADRAADHAVDLLKRSHARELEVNEATRAALRLVIDLEADEREYLLTGSPVFALRYEETRRQLPAELAKLKLVVKDDPVSLDLVERLGALVDKWVEEVARPAMAARRAVGTGHLETGLSPDMVSYPGESLLQASRTLSRQLRTQIHAESVEAEARGSERRRRARRGIGVAAIVAGLLIFLGGWRATRRLGRDITRLASHADSLATGNFASDDAPINSSILGRIDHALDGAARALAWRETAFRVLLTASRETGAAPSRADVAHAVRTAIAEIMPEPRVALVWIDGDRSRVFGIAPAPPDMPASWFDWTQLPDASALHVIRETRSSVVSVDPHRHAYSEDALVLRSGGVTWCAVPIIIGPRVIGAMTVALPAGTLDDGQVRFLETLAQQIGHQLEATELRESLAQRNEELARATQAKSGFLAMMSHELRTPLNSVIGFSEVLADQKFGQLNDKQARFIRNVLDSGRHLLRLINDLLDLSKIEAGRMEVGRQPCDVRELVDAVVTSLQPQAAARRIEVVVEESARSSIWADPVRMKQVLYNFLSNALKFAPEGGKVSVGFSQDANHVRVSVRDNGPGISIEEQDRLFQPFNQLQSVTQEGSSLAGTGLGLALARQFATLMQGRVGVDSDVGRGATFWVEMPRVDTPDDPEVRDESGGPRYEPLALVVDDDAASRELIKLALQAAGYRTAEASDGEQALADARRLQPQVITLDVFLPGIDGWDVLRVLGTDAATKHIPVVVLTIANERQKALALGAREHLLKPIDRELLRRAVGDKRGAQAPPTVDKRVLLIEHEPARAAGLRRELERRGLGVEIAPTGAEALQRLQAEERLDLVLLGLSLPDVPAADIIAVVRAAPRRTATPIVVLAPALDTDERARLREQVQAICDRDGLPGHDELLKVGGVVAGLVRRAGT